jgi:hypothetical protein
MDCSRPEPLGLDLSMRSRFKGSRIVVGAFWLEGSTPPPAAWSEALGGAPGVGNGQSYKPPL